MAELTAARLREVLNYDSETGVFTWRQHRYPHRVGRAAGHTSVAGYRVVMIEGHKPFMHRLAWLYVYGEYPCGEIDHINGKRDDNRIANLRDTTRGQNSCNRPRPSNNTSGYKGANWCKQRSKWLAKIRVNGRVKFLGYFPTAELAGRAYTEAAKHLHGEFSRI